jgi:hypothetical protein
MAKAKTINWTRVYRRLVQVWRDMQTQVPHRQLTIEACGDGCGPDSFLFKIYSREVPLAWTALNVPVQRLNDCRTEREFEEEIGMIVGAALLGLQVTEVKGREIEAEQQSPKNLACQWN